MGKTMKDEQTDFRFWPIAIATAFLSFGVLAFEIILARIFSVMLAYHFVFAVISFALLGLGLGGLFLNFWQRKFSAGMTVPAILCVFSLIAAVIVIIRLPIFESSGFISFRVWIYVVVSMIPFFFAGLTLAVIFQRFAARSSILYGFDLLGATLGAVAAVELLDNFGGVNAAFVTALVTSPAILFVSQSERKWRLPTIGLIAFLALSVLYAGQIFNQVPIAMDANKDMYWMLKNPREQAEMVESKWSSFGRTDLLRSPATPNEMVLFVDGAAGTVMYSLDSLRGNPANQAHLVNHFGLFFPFFFLEESEKDNALIIGAGGGRDVVVALLGGVKEITAVEVNPDLVDLVKRYENFNGGIYTTQSNVQVVVHEGRNYLRSSSQKYDLILLSIPITKSSRSVEGFALTENFLFTVEAFTDYLNHLTPEGRIVIVAHNDAEIYRTIGLALAAFEKRNTPQVGAMKHIYTINPGMMPAIVIKNAPFDSLEINKRHEVSHRLGYDRGNFYLPFVEQVTLSPPERLGVDYEWRMFDQILIDISRGNLTFEQLERAAPLDIHPTFDDSPFFYKFEPGLPAPFGSFSILILLVLVLFTVSLWVTPGSSLAHIPWLHPFVEFSQLKQFLAVFFLLGMGFMLIEISLFQKLTLYLGQPVYALSVLLFSLLLGTGVGSLLSSWIKHRLALTISITAVMVFILTLLINFFLTPLFSFFSTDSRLTAALILVPLGLFLGFPFPLAIRLMNTMQLEKYVGWMWGVNGIASVIGSALAMMTGILIGFSAALLAGAILYCLVTLLFLMQK